MSEIDLMLTNKRGTIIDTKVLNIISVRTDHRILQAKAKFSVKIEEQKWSQNCERKMNPSVSHDNFMHWLYIQRGSDYPGWALGNQNGLQTIGKIQL